MQTAQNAGYSSLNILMSIKSADEGSHGVVTRQMSNKIKQQSTSPTGSSATGGKPENVSQHPLGEPGKDGSGGKEVRAIFESMQ